MKRNRIKRRMPLRGVQQRPGEEEEEEEEEEEWGEEYFCCEMFEGGEGISWFPRFFIFGGGYTLWLGPGVL